MSPRHRHALTASIGLAILLYLTFVLLADQAAVFAALQRIGLPMLLAIFALSLFNYLLRFSGAGSITSPPLATTCRGGDIGSTTWLASS
jgi:hypothetical protein